MAKKLYLKAQAFYDDKQTYEYNFPYETAIDSYSHTTQILSPGELQTVDIPPGDILIMQYVPRGRLAGTSSTLMWFALNGDDTELFNLGPLTVLTTSFTELKVTVPTGFSIALEVISIKLG